MKSYIFGAVVMVSVASNLAFAQEKCGDVFTSSLQERNFISETLEFKTIQLSNLRAGIDAELVKLAQGGPDWKPIDQTLIKKIEQSLKDYNHTTFDIATAEMKKAASEIDGVLRNSNEFKALSNMQREQLVSDLTQGTRSGSRYFSFNVDHLLNQIRMDLGLETSKNLQLKLSVLSEEGQIWSRQSQKLSLLKSLSLLPILHEIKDLSGLYKLKEKLETEVRNSTALPEEVVSKMLAASKEADLRESDSLPESYDDPYMAGKIYMEMLEQHPFFKGLSRSEKIGLQMHVRGMNRMDVVDRLSPFAQTTPDQKLKTADLGNIEKVLEVLK